MRVRWWGNISRLNLLPDRNQVRVQNPVRENVSKELLNFVIVLQIQVGHLFRG